MSLPESLLFLGRNAVTAIGLPFLLSFGEGYLSGSNQTPTSAWFKAAGNPPNIIFPIVWTALYAGMGYASYMVTKVYDRALMGGEKENAASALKLYYLQLALNVLWPMLFFGRKMKKLALIDIVILSGVVFSMTKQMNDLDTSTSTNWFLVPYCAWLSYATYLNAGFVYLNRSTMVPKAE